MSTEEAIRKLQATIKELTAGMDADEQGAFLEEAEAEIDTLWEAWANEND